MSESPPVKVPNPLKENFKELLPLIPIVLVAVYLFFAGGYAPEEVQVNDTPDAPEPIQGESFEVKFEVNNTFGDGKNLDHRRFEAVYKNTRCPEVYTNTSEGWERLESNYISSFSSSGRTFKLKNVNQGEEFKLCSVTREGTFYRSEAFRLTQTDAGRPVLKHEWDSRDPLFLRLTEYNENGRVIKLIDFEFQVERTYRSTESSDGGWIPFF